MTAKIKKIPVSRAKNSLRYRGIGLTLAEKAMLTKINEIIDFLNRA